MRGGGQRGEEEISETEEEEGRVKREERPDRGRAHRHALFCFLQFWYSSDGHTCWLSAPPAKLEPDLYFG